jgi:hypothetical protein
MKPDHFDCFRQGKRIRFEHAFSRRLAAGNLGRRHGHVV